MKPFVDKPRMKCLFIGFSYEKTKRIAWIKRLEDHPVLGPPRRTVTRTSIVIRRGQNEIETLNSIYWWDQ